MMKSQRWEIQVQQLPEICFENINTFETNEVQTFCDVVYFFEPFHEFYLFRRKSVGHNKRRTVGIELTFNDVFYPRHENLRHERWMGRMGGRAGGELKNVDMDDQK
jgi:hypothetical protein